MAEVLAHPWLEGYTPGILYVPAPPVAELAKPLPSASYIDRDLFQSLCVIWGRYCDPDRIKMDLLSPAGDGQLVKAFYFLLQKHRERTMAEHGILMDDILKSPGKVVTKQYCAPKARPRKAFSEVIPDMARVSSQLAAMSARAAVGTPSRSPSPSRPVLPALQIPALDKASPRAHPPSPVGPRPQRPRPTSSPIGDRRATNMGPPAPYSKYDQRPRLCTSRGPTSVEDTEMARASQQMSDMIASLPHHSQIPRRTQSSTTTTSRSPSAAESVFAQFAKDYGPSSAIHAPVPVPATPQKILPMIAAPRVHDAELQRKMDEFAKLVNAQALDWNATAPPGGSEPTQGQPASINQAPEREREPVRGGDQGPQPMQTDEPSSAGPSSGPQRRVDDRASDNKENMDQQTSATPVKKHVQGGLGFGSSVPMPIAPMTKEMANLLYLNNNGGHEKRERKHLHHRRMF